MNNRIGIVPNVVFDSVRNENRIQLDTEWLDMLLDMGLTPEILPICHNQTYLKYVISKCDGFLLTGSGEIRSLNAPGSDQIRYRELAEDHILEKMPDKPTIGICRGAQKMADFYGLKLVPVSGHVRTWHELSVGAVKTSRPLVNSVAADLRELKYINSYHDYSIEKPTDLNALLLEGVAMDGTLELAVFNEHALGIMWHPEREKENRDIIMKVFTKWFRLKT